MSLRKKKTRTFKGFTKYDTYMVIIINMREDCRNVEDDLDPEVVLKCTYCFLVSEAIATHW